MSLPVVYPLPLFVPRQCGCNTLLPCVNKHGLPRTFAHGHNRTTTTVKRIVSDEEFVMLYRTTPKPDLAAVVVWLSVSNRLTYYHSFGVASVNIVPENATYQHDIVPHGGHDVAAAVLHGALVGHLHLQFALLHDGDL